MNDSPNASPHHERTTITARTVGWALSAATIGSLLLGLMVVEYFGKVSDRPPIEREPEPLVSQKPTLPPPPTKLRSMSRRGSSEAPQEGFEWIAPAEAAPASPDDYGARLGDAATAPGLH
ncbi:hypothetical protein Pla123a_22670 [Posidoniimonas polymericola]|uniref:Uncharacterized protein n=1 Tax=Posidoniimonas polymericola TaxID=2528002 RepID=A0A5C5YPK1_9BACT|nr:hypothetical protein [Posidoniimonas polymericola]TWT76844.1 hypothetical protein Pla123a_22670 [Posidoniimonas polymericola]